MHSVVTRRVQHFFLYCIYLSIISPYPNPYTRKNGAVAINRPSVPCLASYPLLHKRLLLVSCSANNVNKAAVQFVCLAGTGGEGDPLCFSSSPVHRALWTTLRRLEFGNAVWTVQCSTVQCCVNCTVQYSTVQCSLYSAVYTVHCDLYTAVQYSQCELRSAVQCELQYSANCTVSEVQYNVNWTVQCNANCTV